MTNFQFSQYVTSRRKALGVTQEQIANYIGVSKAAISKWEKGQSYPNITLLPKLATYFNVSIDDLLGYEPQMMPEKISETYAELCERFNNESFEQVAETIESIIAEYYSCFPLLLTMAQLYINYAKQAEDSQAIFERAWQLLARVKEMSSDYKVLNEANSMQAFIRIMQNEPQKVIDTLGEDAKILYGEEQLIATAHLMLGNTDKAQEILQVAHFQHILMGATLATETLLIDARNFDETVCRVMTLIEQYKLEVLNVNTAFVFYLKAAMGYTMQGRLDEALAMIERYVKTCTTVKFPIELRGDDYFYLLEGWVRKESNLGTQAPRSSYSIKKDLYETIAHNPAFAPLHENLKFKNACTNLRHHLQMEEDSK